MSDAFGSLDLFSAFSRDNDHDTETYNDAENGLNAAGTEDAREIAELRAENTRLKSRIRLYERFGHLFPCQTPLAEIDYFKSPLSRECQARIESELYTVLTENRDTTDENGPESDYESFGHVLYLPYYIIDSVGKYWDSTPVQYGDNTPLFTSVFTVALDDREDRLDMFGAKLPKENMSSGPECFNCGGPHRLAECKQPHDKKKIQGNLKQFKEARGGSNYNDRYHVRVAKEIEPRYKEFVPGKMSDSLRLALGLENHDLPPHVYRMRTFGYPPGYSLDPPLSNSEGMQFYYTPNAASREDGEIEETPLPCVVEFPGYTAALPPDAIDKHRPRNPTYSATTPTLSDKRKPSADHLSKRRKVDHALGSREKQEDDMDVDDEKEIEPAYARPIIQQPPPPPPMPEDPPPNAPSPPPLPPGIEDVPDSKPEVRTPAKTKPFPKPAATSTPLAAAQSESESETKADDKSERESKGVTVVQSTDKTPSTSGQMGETKTVKSAAKPDGLKLNRSIVSETNKIGIKFDQADDYGPLDERAGNFTKLQCILRSRKRGVTSTPSKPPIRTRSSRRGKK